LAPAEHLTTNHGAPAALPFTFLLLRIDNRRGMDNPVETKPLNIEDVDFEDEDAINAFDEALIDSGQAKFQDDCRRLQEMGIIDAEGNQLKTIVPADMLDPDADFGG